MISDEQWELLELLVAKGKLVAMDIDELLTAANYLFSEQGKLLDAALEIIDTQDDQRFRPVHEYVEETSSRRYWKVIGSHDTQYLCLEGYCNCPFFMNAMRSHSADVQGRIVCKHLIAVRLASALRRVEIHRLPLEKFMAGMNPQQQAAAHATATIASFHPSFSTPLKPN